MKPFNLEAAMRGEKVITRNGEDFLFGGYNPNVNSKYEQVIGWVGDAVHSCSVTGKYESKRDDRYDLFMAPVKYSGWVNVYDTGPGGILYPTKEQAESAYIGDRVACIYVEYKEGEVI